MRGALICALPPIIALIWYFGFLAAWGIPVDFLTTIVPTMVIVVAFADGVHLYVSIEAKHDGTSSLKEAAAFAIATTGPACFLASLTTAMAFIGIGLGGADTMHRLSITGTVGVLLAFLSVILILPTLTHLLIGRRSKSVAQTARFLQLPARPAIWLALRHRKPLILGALLISVGLIGIHLSLPASFSVTDYLSDNAKVRQDERFIEEKFGGSGRLFAMIADPDGERGLSPKDRDEMAALLTSLNTQLESPIDPAPVLDLLARIEGADLRTTIRSSAALSPRMAFPTCCQSRSAAWMRPRTSAPMSRPSRPAGKRWLCRQGYFLGPVSAHRRGDPASHQRSAVRL